MRYWKTYFILVAAALVVLAQQSDLLIKITGANVPVVALPDLRGAGAAGQFMGAFNDTLAQDLQESSFFRIAPKSSYPLNVPQRPQDFRPPETGGKKKAASEGPWLTDWSGAPVNANYLAFGYTAEQNGQIVLFGWFYDVLQPDLQNAEIIGRIYFGSLDEAGAIKVAHDFAADILALVGAKSLAGTQIYFVSQRTGNKEIWSMDYDGSNQKQVTNLRDISRDPALSYDRTRLAFTTFANGNPSLMVLSTETGRQMPFYNQRASLNHTPEFLPDGRIMFSSTAAGGAPQLYLADPDGGNLRRITHTTAIEISPKVNPKNPNQIVFVSGRSGVPQVYRMNMDGTDVERLSSGEGEAVQPSWSPNGEFIAFSWTRGFAPGNYNVFIMSVASREYVQLTHGQGRNENPSWAPDGRRLVFSSNRSGSTQIWTMLADGTQARQLTTQGRNENPVWSR